MKKQILITDSLFLYREHEDRLKSGGFEIERLHKPKASEQELCSAIRGKHGYVHGGIEEVTSKVIASADKLEAIAFAGSGYADFIVARETATRKGIAISATIGAVAPAVAEYTLALILAMVRNLPSLTTITGSHFYIASELQSLTLGIVGLGHIGTRVARQAQALGMKVIATSRSKPINPPINVELVPLENLLQNSDIISIHVSKKHGTGIIGRSQIELMKSGTILVNTGFPQAVDIHALHDQLVSKRLRAAFDAPPDRDFSHIPLGYFLASNAQAAFNTRETHQRISDRATNSLINLLTTGNDSDLVNPEFKKYRNQLNN